MPITKEVTLYHFDELSDRAKDKARDWWRDCENQDFDTEFLYDDFEECAKALGVEFDKQAVKLMGGGTRYDPVIYWSGFYSQGDGACFEGSYAYRKGSAKAIRAHAPQDAELHRIANELAAVQKANGYQVRALAKHRGHYYHSGCMAVDVFHNRSGNGVEERFEQRVTQALRDFADWMWRQMREEYEYRMSDEQVDESIRANEYTFTEEGKRED